MLLKFFSNALMFNDNVWKSFIKLLILDYPT